MYRIICLISAFIRTYYFPNPFTRFFETLLIETPFKEYAPIVADLFNLSIGSIILGAISFLLTGIVYENGEAPAVGSIIYFIIILFNSWVLIGISYLGLSITISIVIFVISIVLESIILLSIRYRY